MKEKRKKSTELTGLDTSSQESEHAFLTAHDTPHLNVTIRQRSAVAMAQDPDEASWPASATTMTTPLGDGGMLAGGHEPYVDDFITELWSTLKMIDCKAEEWDCLVYNTHTSQFALSPRFAASCSTVLASGHGARHVNELLQRCSECRSELLTLKQFGAGRVLGSNGHDNGYGWGGGVMVDDDAVSTTMAGTPIPYVTDYTELLLGPLRSMAKRCCTDAMVEVQMKSIHIRDLAGISSFLVSFKERVDKVHNFLKPIIQVLADAASPVLTQTTLMTPGFSSSNGSIVSSQAINRVVRHHQQQQAEQFSAIEQQWNKFLLLLMQSPAEIEDEVPGWERLYREMLQMLGSFCDQLCRTRRFQVVPEWQPQQSHVSLHSQWQHAVSIPNTGGSRPLSRSSSRTSVHRPISCLVTPMKGRDNNATTITDVDMRSTADEGESEIADSPQFFRLLFTRKLRTTLRSAFRQEEKIATNEDRGEHCLVDAQTFQELFRRTLHEAGDIAVIGHASNTFKETVRVLETAAAAYQAQFDDYIMHGVRETKSLETTLREIKELYSLRAFAQTISIIVEKPDGRWMEELSQALVSATTHDAKKDGAGPHQQGNEWRIVQRAAQMPEMDDDEGSIPEQSLSNNSDERGDPPWWSFELECKLEWPLGCVLDTDLFLLLDRCMERCQCLYHAYETITHLVVSKTHPMGSAKTKGCRTRRLLAQKLLETIRAIYTVLRDQFEKLIEKASTAILHSKSTEQMEHAVDKWTALLDDALGSEKLRDGSSVHTTANAICELIYEFHHALEMWTTDGKSGIGESERNRELDAKVTKMSKRYAKIRIPLVAMASQQQSQLAAIGRPSVKPPVSEQPSVASAIAMMLSR